MKNKILIAGISLAALSLLAVAGFAQQNAKTAKALNEEVGSFEVIAGSDYTVDGTTLSTTTGSFVAKAVTGDEFHFSTKILQSSGQNDAFGIVLNGEYADGHLSGDVVRLWLNGSQWYLDHGTLVNDVYSNVYSFTSQFDTSFSGQLDMYIYNGVVALRMDNWHIAGFELVNVEGDTFIYSNGASFSVQNPTISALTSKIANYLYRNGWGGWNHYGYTYCYGQGSNHSFTMTLPTTLDTSKVTKLILSRDTIERTAGQEADVVVNGTPAGSFGNNASNSQGFTSFDLELPLSLIASTKTLNIVINVTGNELVAHNYKLMYETAEGRFAADHLVLHSTVSETRHNYSTSALGWNDNQYLFMNVNQNLASESYYWAGVTPGKPTLLMNNYDLFSGPQVNYVFESNEAQVINFLDYANLRGATAWSFRNELWLDVGAGGTYYGPGTLNASATALSGHYYLDFFFGDMDASIGVERKITLQNDFTITVDDLGIVKGFCGRLLSTTQSFAEKTVQQKSDAWSALETEYGTLSDSQKELFKTSDDSDIVAAAARYGCIVSRNYQGLNDFVFETVPSPANAMRISLDNSSLAFVIVPIVITSLTIAFALVLKRKKKEQ